MNPNETLEFDVEMQKTETTILKQEIKNLKTGIIALCVLILGLGIFTQVQIDKHNTKLAKVDKDLEMLAVATAYSIVNH